MDWLNFDGFPSRIGPTHISEDWARLTLELPALATVQLLCHLGFGPVLCIKTDLLGEKTLVAFQIRTKSPSVSTVPNTAGVGFRILGC
jgi:hypothetical protein